MLALQVCHHYLVPLLATIPLDSSLLKRPEPVQSGPPETLQEKVAGEKHCHSQHHHHHFCSRLLEKMGRVAVLVRGTLKRVELKTMATENLQQLSSTLSIHSGTKILNNDHVMYYNFFSSVSALTILS